MITHVVLFRFRDRTPEQAQRAKELLEGMVGGIAELRHLEVGVDVLRSERSWDLCLTTHFDSLDDLAVYATHPVHVPVAKELREASEQVAVVDYET